MRYQINDEIVINLLCQTLMVAGQVVRHNTFIMAGLLSKKLPVSLDPKNRKFSHSKVSVRRKMKIHKSNIVIEQLCTSYHIKRKKFSSTVS